MIFTVLEIVFLFIAIWWIPINTFKVITGERVPAINFFIQAIGITGWIVCHFYF